MFQMLFFHILVLGGVFLVQGRTGGGGGGGGFCYRKRDIKILITKVLRESYIHHFRCQITCLP